MAARLTADWPAVDLRQNVVSASIPDADVRCGRMIGMGVPDPRLPPKKDALGGGGAVSARMQPRPAAAPADIHRPELASQVEPSAGQVFDSTRMAASQPPR